MAFNCENCLEEFPVWGLLPRKETGVKNLLLKQPEFDGRGTTLAVFDSGVDPAAPGLQVTSDGKVKVIARIDASGAGDVDTSVVTEAVDGELTGLTGRKLKVPEGWLNPTGNYHLGIKPAFSLYPQKLREYVSDQHKRKKWDPIHKLVIAEAQKNSQKFEKTTSSKTSSTTGNKGENGNSPSENKPKSSEEPTTNCIGGGGGGKEGGGLSYLEKLQKEDAEAKVTLLTQMEKKFCNLGPAYDCVVFHDGEVWRVCIDTSECGNLSEGVFLGEYEVTHEWATLTTTDQYTISVNVYNDGNILEIVGMSSSHGTHVASIAAACFPDDPERNGVAPGAQIVSITIGDNRLGSMETGTALVRAMIRVMESPHYKVNIINMSYGEHPHTSESGRLGELVHEVVSKYGIIWVASASNHGPALGTIGVPPDFHTDSVIGVGAYVSPDMMTASYSMTEKLPGSPYTWSSRGPTADGGRGVSVCAPGGAITSVPKFTLKNNQLMNGTSMVSPHTAGCVCLLVSALMQKEILFTPFSVRRALQNTALKLNVDTFAQGHGLVQVDKALEYLMEFSGCHEDKFYLNVQCGKDQAKGILLRNWKAEHPIDWSVTIEPSILDESRADPNDKINFNLELVLSCDAPWVKAPKCLQLSYTFRVFKISIDPRGLERGHAYFTSIKGYIASCPTRGPIFEVPITVIVPLLQLNNGCQFTSACEHYTAGLIKRYFIYVPPEATWATINLKASSKNKFQRFTLQAVQLKPASSIRSLEFYKTLNLNANESTSLVMSVRGNLTLEVCLARWWSCLVDGSLQLTVDFHSIKPNQEEVCFTSNDWLQRVDLQVGLRNQDVLPQATLKQHVQVLAPSESKVEVIGGERDTIPNGRPIYKLILTYLLSITRANVEVTPKCSILNDVLYESPYESQLWMAFDCNKRLLGVGDAYCHDYKLKLSKGDYTIRLIVRHEREELLDKLSDLPLTVISKLPQEVKLDVYSTYNAAIASGKKMQCMKLPMGSQQPIYITAPNLTDKTFKGVGISPGHYLVGSVSFAKDESTLKADNYPLRIFVTEFACKKKSSSSSSDDKKESKSYSDYQEALRDMKTSWISKIDAESSDRLYEEVIANHPDHLSAQVARLCQLETEGEAKRGETEEMAKKVAAAVDTCALLAFYGTRNDTRTDASKIRAQIDRQRSFLLDGLSKQGSCLCHSLIEVPHDERDTDTIAALHNIATEILKFVDASNSQVSSFFVLYYRVCGLHALAASLLSKQHEEKPSKETEAKLIQIYTDLGWNHIVQHMLTSQPIRFPNAFVPF